jgi:phosphate transport system substrate-binding protein
MIHRDLKPSNVMITDLPSGSIQSKLLDFGLAKFIDVQAPSPQTVSIDGTIHGSTHYISPEQLRREPVGVYSDLYSLGCTFYFALTGQPPFGGANVTEVITSHLSHLVPLPVELRPEISRGLSQWLLRMIERQPADRFSDALVALQALREAVNSDQILPKTTHAMPVRLGKVHVTVPEMKHVAPAPQPKRKKGRVILFSSGLAAILAVGAFVGSFGLGDQAANFSPEPAVPVSLEVAQSPVQEPPALPSPDRVESAVVVENEVAVVASPVIPPAILPIPSREPKIMFRVAGSNTLGAKLIPSLVEKFLLRMQASNVVQEQRQANETLLTYELAGSTERHAVLIQAHGSSTAFPALKDETCEIGMSSRPIKPTEVEGLHLLGNMLSPACEHVVGLDGLAVVVHRSNPLQALSLAQIAGIFSGQIRDWSEVGGSPGAIHLYARDDFSGTYDCFRSLVLGDGTLDSQAKRYEDSVALSDEVAGDVSGIGFIGLPYVRNTKALVVAEPGVQGLLPTPFSVATEDYLLSRRLFLYSPAVPKHPWTGALIDFVLSDEGQRLVEEAGFISQRVEIEKVPLAEGVTERYRKFAKTAAGRLSLSFRFRSGNTDLDTKAMCDIDRVVKLLAKPENRRKSVCLLGFSDQSGSRAANLKISEERAQKISAQLALRGVPVTEILAMGAEMPVALNTTKSGQDKNRRVEIWVGNL